MSDYFFGLSHDRITRKESRRRERIAKKHGASLVNIDRHFMWFSCPNRGEPFNSRTRIAVLSEIGVKQKETKP